MTGGLDEMGWLKHGYKYFKYQHLSACRYGQSIWRSGVRRVSHVRHVVHGFSVPEHFQFPNTSTNGSGFSDIGNYSPQITTTGNYSRARIYVNANAMLVVDYVQAHDITTILQKKWRIVFVYSQSNWAGHGDAADRVQIDTPEPCAIVITSSEQSTRGAFLDAEDIGVPILMCDPVVHLSGNVGGGPAGAFARSFCDGLRDDEVLIYVTAGYSGGGRLTPGDVWYHADGEESVIA